LLRQAFSTDPWVRPTLQLGTLSCVTIQFELTNRALESDRTNFADGSLCCYAEQSCTTFRHVAGRFSAILYPPAKFLEMPDAQIAEEACAAAAELRIPLREIATQYRVIRHPQGFYAM